VLHITRTTFHELRTALLADELVSALPASLSVGICAPHLQISYDLTSTPLAGT
jgi:hypothetical protein